MPTVRQEKASRLIQKELSILFQKEAKALFNGAMVSVTTVRMSPDLKEGKVYVSFFGVKDKEAMLAHMNAIQGDIRRRLGSVMRNQLRHIPELRFYLDDSLDYAEEIVTLLNKDKDQK